MSSVGNLNMSYLANERRRRQNFAALLPFVILIDALSIAFSQLSVGWLYSQLSPVSGLLSLTPSLVAFVFFAVIAACRSDYAFETLTTVTKQLHQTALAWTFAVLMLVATNVLFKFDNDISRSAMFVFYIVGSATLLSWRALLATVLMRVRSHDTLASTGIVLLSDQTVSQTLRAELRNSGLDVSKLFVVNEETNLPQLVMQVLNTTSKDVSVSSVFVAVPWTQHVLIKRLLAELAIVPLPVRLLPDKEVASFLDKPLLKIGGLWTAEIQRMPLSRPEQITKRAFDVILATCLVLLLLPLLIAVAILIKLDSGGPIIFTQMRNGFNNRAFRIYKLRTLRTLEDGPIIKQVTADDPRLTRIGRLLRRFSIDELPQLINVLKGEMSLVGPRPHAVAHNSQYALSIVNYAFRHHVKPGLTGWAQIHGFRGETRTLAAMQHRIDFDMWYINNWSLWLDVKIVLRTGIVLLRELDFLRRFK